MYRREQFESESPIRELRKDGRPKLPILSSHAYQEVLSTIEFDLSERKIIETVASSPNQAVAAVELNMSYKDLAKVFRKIRLKHGF